MFLAGMKVGAGSGPWFARPKLGLFLRVLSVLLPLAAAVLAAVLVAVLVSGRTGWWWFAVAAAAVLAAWASVGWSGRLWLLGMTYEMELVFPDRTPRRADVVKLVERPELGSDGESVVDGEAHATAMLLSLRRSHSRDNRDFRIAAVADFIRRQLHLDQPELADLRWRAVSDEIGKLAFPPELLAAKLSPEASALLSARVVAVATVFNHLMDGSSVPDDVWRQAMSTAAADPEVVRALLMIDESQMRSLAGGSPLERVPPARVGAALALAAAVLMISGMALTGSLLPAADNKVRVGGLLAFLEPSSGSASLAGEATTTSRASNSGSDTTTSSPPGSPSSSIASSAPTTSAGAPEVNRPGSPTTSTQAPTTTLSPSSTTSTSSATTTTAAITTTTATTTTTAGVPSPTTTQAPTTTTTLAPTTTTTLAPTTTTTLAPTTTTTTAPACDPAYPGVCIPPPPPDLNCDDISERNFTVLPPDPHGFDGDGDGIGCELTT